MNKMIRRNIGILMDIANGETVRSVAKNHQISTTRIDTIWKQTLKEVDGDLFAEACGRTGRANIADLRAMSNAVLLSIRRFMAAGGECDGPAEYNDYESKRNGLIKHAVSLANSECGSVNRIGDDELYSAAWNRVYHLEMHRLAREAGLQGW